MNKEDISDGKLRGEGNGHGVDYPELRDTEGLSEKGDMSSGLRTESRRARYLEEREGGGGGWGLWLGWVSEGIVIAWIGSSRWLSLGCWSCYYRT